MYEEHIIELKKLPECIIGNMFRARSTQDYCLEKYPELSLAEVAPLIWHGSGSIGCKLLDLETLAGQAPSSDFKDMQKMIAEESARRENIFFGDDKDYIYYMSYTNKHVPARKYATYCLSGKDARAMTCDSKYDNMVIDKVLRKENMSMYIPPMDNHAEVHGTAFYKCSQLYSMDLIGMDKLADMFPVLQEVPTMENPFSKPFIVVKYTAPLSYGIIEPVGSTGVADGFWNGNGWYERTDSPSTKKWAEQMTSRVTLYDPEENQFTIYNVLWTALENMILRPSSRLSQKDWAFIDAVSTIAPRVATQGMSLETLSNIFELKWKFNDYPDR